jgi:hypothetical protein
MVLSGLEQFLGGAVLSLFGLGGGIWIGSRDKVTRELFETNIKNLNIRFDNLKTRIDSSILESCNEDKTLHGRLTEITERLSRIEGRLNGGFKK